MPYTGDTSNHDDRPQTREERQAQQKNVFRGFVVAFALVVVVIFALMIAPGSGETPTTSPTVATATSAQDSTEIDTLVDDSTTTEPSESATPDAESCTNPDADITEPVNGRRIDGDHRMNLMFSLNCLPVGHKARLMDKPVKSNLVFSTSRANPLLDDGSKIDSSIRLENEALHFPDSHIGGEGTRAKPVTTTVELRIYSGPPKCIKLLDSDAGRDGIPVSKLKRFSCKNIGQMTFTSTRTEQD